MSDYRSRLVRHALALAIGLKLMLAQACGASPPEAATPAGEPARAPFDSGAPVTASSDAGADATGRATTMTTDAGIARSGGECPSDMVHVKKDFCPKVDRYCLKDEYDKPNHLTICHRFKEGVTKCLEPRVPLDFCVDRYEYPNEKGAHPPVMVSFFDGAGLCAAKGKRLCYESEWTAACEGPEEKPFPNGWERSAEICNIDNTWVEPSLKKIYSDDAALRDAELERLDRSVPSGSKPGCKSDYGVYDLTGNVDEWVLADHDRPKEKAKFSALKGGAWGHVRNACRPVTTSHEPDFTYYFVSFRCCKEPASVKKFEGN